MPRDESVSIEPLTTEAVRALLEPQPAPCLSLYLTTHRNVPENTVDLPTYRHLVEALELALEAACPRDASERLLHPFRRLAGDVRFWRHARAGLAVLGAAGRARCFLLERPVEPLALVGPRFHTLPLVRAVAGLEGFSLLALTSRAAEVFTGTVWHDPRGSAPGPLVPLPLVETPGGAPTLELARSAVVDAEILEPHRVKTGTGPAGRAAGAVVHGGFGGKQDDIDADTEIFLRHVDEVVLDQVSRPLGLPLVLVAAAPLAAVFRGLSHNPLLVDDFVDLDPHLAPHAAVAAAATPVFARARERFVARELRAFALARDRGTGAGDLADVARAAVAGRVATLLVEADRFEPGHLDRDTGAIEFTAVERDELALRGGRPAVTHEDLLGAVAEVVLEKGGTIVALPRIAMPTEGGVAAIYRY